MVNCTIYGQSSIWGRASNIAKVMRDFIANFRLLIVALFSTLVLTTAVHAATEFDSQCQRLLPLTDDFARKCLTEAVPFSRVHNKTGNEEFRVLFSNAYPNSHFIMGCMVDWQNRLRYVGMYYKTSRINCQFSRAIRAVQWIIRQMLGSTLQVASRS
ncbi:hypothetical protein FHW17_004993 [Phyllobacterium sp. P30BS-XVII]|nr:hypothetical protein [Phyllobacterium sp. P30BS-XVII]